MIYSPTSSSEKDSHYRHDITTLPLLPDQIFGQLFGFPIYQKKKKWTHVTLITRVWAMSILLGFSRKGSYLSPHSEYAHGEPTQNDAQSTNKIPFWYTNCSCNSIHPRTHWPLSSICPYFLDPWPPHAPLKPPSKHDRCKNKFEP